MNGTQDREKKINTTIESLINNNPEIKCLRGYRFFINNLASASVYQYMMIVKNFMQFSKKDTSELTLDDYTFYLGSIRDKSSSYQITAYTALKKFSLYLEANQINIKNPMQYVGRPKPIYSLEADEKRNNNFLSKSEIKKLKSNLDNGIPMQRHRKEGEMIRERDTAIIMLFLSTGMRVSALIKLDLNNIYMESQSIKVIDKGSKIIEYVVGDKAWEALMLWLEKRNNFPNADNLEALFLSVKGKRIGRDSVTYLIKKYAKGINKNMSPHKLRATYGTQIYEAKKDVYFVQKCMNHSSPTTTALYIRGQKNGTEEASEIMNKLF